MLQFLATLLGRSARRPQPTPAPARKPARIGVEELTPRVLLNAGPIGLGAGGFAGHGPFHAGAADPSNAGTAGQGSVGDPCGRASLVANLSNSSGATGQALFNSANGSLSVRVQGAAASTTLPVTVNGTSVGTLSTNAAGNGQAVFTNVTGQAGQAVVVGDLTGTLAQTHLSATLTGATGVSGTARFDAARGTLDVSIRGAAANTTYDVTINGTVVGMFTTNARGQAHLDVTTPVAAVSSGATVSVADTAGNPAILQGTLA